MPLAIRVSSTAPCYIDPTGLKIPEPAADRERPADPALVEIGEVDPLPFANQSSSSSPLSRVVLLLPPSRIILSPSRIMEIARPAIIRVMRQMRGNRRRGDTEGVLLPFVTGRHVAEFDLAASPAAREITASTAFDPAIGRAAIAGHGIPVVTLLVGLKDLVAAELNGELNGVAARVARIRIRWLALLARLHDPVAARDRDRLALLVAGCAVGRIALLEGIHRSVTTHTLLDRAGGRTTVPGQGISIVAPLARLHGPVTAHGGRRSIDEASSLDGHGGVEASVGDVRYRKSYRVDPACNHWAGGE